MDSSFDKLFNKKLVTTYVLLDKINGTTVLNLYSHYENAENEAKEQLKCRIKKQFLYCAILDLQDWTDHEEKEYKAYSDDIEYIEKERQQVNEMIQNIWHDYEIIPITFIDPNRLYYIIQDGNYQVYKTPSDYITQDLNKWKEITYINTPSNNQEWLKECTKSCM